MGINPCNILIFESSCAVPTQNNGVLIIMDRKTITNVIYDALKSNGTLFNSVFEDGGIPEKIDDIELTLSSLEFVDLLIDVENRIGLELADECFNASKISIGHLAKRIEQHV